LWLLQARIPAGVLLPVPLLLPDLSCQAPGTVGYLAARELARRGATPPGSASRIPASRQPEVQFQSHGTSGWPATCTGSVLPSICITPTCPSSLVPQQYKIPERLMPHVWLVPAAMELNLNCVATGPGSCSRVNCRPLQITRSLGPVS
jgi:hypothetical protein